VSSAVKVTPLSYETTALTGTPNPLKGTPLFPEVSTTSLHWTDTLVDRVRRKYRETRVFAINVVGAGRLIHCVVWAREIRTEEELIAGPMGCSVTLLTTYSVKLTLAGDVEALSGA
jgi:hypothetical protein